MKRQKLIKHLNKHNCILLLEGANHSIYQNLKSKEQSAVGRHNELSELLCNKVCKQLKIPHVSK
ncbi:MAG: addiction module toxin, HicA family [Bacteroidetes bacterium 4484_276]|nr:MAG: addiction module toxin, HicA family [Bacteroidetes bacterium 4484_276]OYT13574.1 MAG: addiction module toxin, HicA family [Bacteroidetes bacterium 4572_114]